jgi:hypothetical protein
MNRREVIVKMGGLLLVLPAAKILMACGSDSGSGTLTFISSTDLGHSHTVGLQVTEINTPPSGGVTKTTSNDLNHTHTVSLTSAELDSIATGSTVTKTTSMDDSHTHTFDFKKS